MKCRSNAFFVVRFGYDLLDPGARAAQVRQHGADGVCPERVLPHAATHTLAFGIFHVLASRTELLHTNEIGNV